MSGYIDDRAWWIAAGKAQLRERGINPESYESRFGTDAVARGARSGVLGWLYLYPDDRQWRYTSHAEWDPDRLIEQGWTEYPVPGPGRVHTHPEIGAVTIHRVQSYIDAGLSGKYVPRSNTPDGRHVAFQRVGIKSVALVTSMLVAAAPTLGDVQITSHHTE